MRHVRRRERAAGSWNPDRLAHAPAGLTWGEAQADARALATNRNPLRLLMGAVGVADAVVVFALSLVAFVLRHGVEPIPLEVFLAAALGGVLTVNALSLSGAYSYAAHGKDGFATQSIRALQAWSVVFVFLVLVGYLAKTVTEYSRAWALLWYVSVAFGLTAVRAASATKLRRWRGRGRLASTVAIVDLCGRSEEFARRLARGGVREARLLGVFSDGTAGRHPSTVSDLIALSRLFRIDEVLVFVSGETTADLDPLLRLLGTIPTNVRLCPALPRLAYAPIRDAGLVHGIPALTVHRRPLGDWNSVIKRCEDLVLGGVATVLLTPVMLAVALLVKLDSPGPVLFRQARQGFNNNVITVLKFRTMVHRPEPERPEPERDVPQAKRDDARVTRIGRLLRRTSLDELPQLLNVLRGEMSLVGPRPHAVAHNRLYAGQIDAYLGRHRVQPGITGWAQVNGLRGETDTLDKMQRRVEYDLAYIDNWSVLLDLKILVLTAISVVFDRDAAY